jgi:hypothetical protein
MTVSILLRISSSITGNFLKRDLEYIKQSQSKYYLMMENWVPFLKDCAEGKDDYYQNF